MSETFSPAAVDDERGSMDAAAKSAPIDAQVRRFLRYAPYFEGKRIVEAYIEWLEKWFVPKIYQCCREPASGDHSPTCPLYGAPTDNIIPPPPGWKFVESSRRVLVREERKTPAEQPTTVDGEADQRDGDD